MKAYVATSGAIFGLVVVAHILRIVQEPALAREPWFVLITVAAGGLTVWAWRSVRQAMRR